MLTGPSTLLAFPIGWAYASCPQLPGLLQWYFLQIFDCGIPPWIGLKFSNVPKMLAGNYSLIYFSTLLRERGVWTYNRRLSCNVILYPAGGGLGRG